MELKVYDLDLNLLGIVDNATSVRWRTKYYEPGETEIHVPATADNINLFKTERIVRHKAAGESGIIEGVTIERSNSGRDIAVTGRYPVSIYDRRLIKDTTYFNDAIEAIMFSIVKNVIPFPHVEYAALKGFTDRVLFQATYKNVLTYLTKLAKAGNIGYRLVPDFEKKRYVFETYRGIDHSYDQVENPRVIFSDTFNNLSGITYEKNDTLLKNVIYVGGQGEGDARTYVTVGDTSLTGFNLREEFLSATDVSQEDQSAEDYKTALRERGNAKLNEDVVSESVTGTVIPKANFEYKKDYDIGDIVSVNIDSLGYKQSVRITEIESVYERGLPKITPTFGTPVPESIDWSDK